MDAMTPEPHRAVKEGSFNLRGDQARVAQVHYFSIKCTTPRNTQSGCATRAVRWQPCAAIPSVGTATTLPG